MIMEVYIFLAKGKSVLYHVKPSWKHKNGLLPGVYLAGGFGYYSVTLQNDHLLLCCEVFVFYLWIS